MLEEAITSGEIGEQSYTVFFFSPMNIYVKY